jgi:hypothetical protein
MFYPYFYTDTLKIFDKNKMSYDEERVFRLHAALDSGNMREARRIIDEVTPPSGPLTIVAAGSNPEFLEYVLEKGGDPNYDEEDFDENVLESAINDDYDDAEEKLQLCLRYGADINKLNHRGTTLLIDKLLTYFEGVFDTPRIIEILLNHGADFNKLDENGKSALDYAKEESGKWDGQRGKRVMRIFNRLLYRWRDICDILNDEGLDELRTITINNVNEENFDDIKETLKFSNGNLNQFSDYVNSLSKRKLCEYLSRYYILKKCISQSDENGVLLEPIERIDLNSEDYKGEPLIFIRPNCYKLSNIVRWYNSGNNNRRKDPTTRRDFDDDEIDEIENRS